MKTKVKKTEEEKKETLRLYQQKYSREWRQKNRLKYNETKRRWKANSPKQREQGKEYAVYYYKIKPEKRKLAVRKWEEKNPEKVRVHQIVKKAIKDKILVMPERCSKCNEYKKLDAHHQDYSKPLEVMWLCRLCHRRHHNEQKLSKAKQKGDELN